MTIRWCCTVYVVDQFLEVGDASASSTVQRDGVVRAASISIWQWCTARRWGVDETTFYFFVCTWSSVHTDSEQSKWVRELSCTEISKWRRVSTWMRRLSVPQIQTGRATCKHMCRRRDASPCTLPAWSFALHRILKVLWICFPRRRRPFLYVRLP